MIGKLVSIEKQFLKATAKAVAEESAELQSRQDQYQQLVEDGKLAASKGPADYWRDVKSTFLDQIETTSREELKNRLNKAFDANMATYLALIKETEPAVQGAGDIFYAGLAALRSTMATRLKRLVESGAFN